MFKWSANKTKAALALANGATRDEAAVEASVTVRTIYGWLAVEEFSAEVDKLSLMVGVASRAERLRIAQRMAKQRVRDDGTVESDKDILDWLKFAQSETDGIKLDLASIATAAASVAGTGSDRAD